MLRENIIPKIPVRLRVIYCESVQQKVIKLQAIVSFE